MIIDAHGHIYRRFGTDTEDQTGAEQLKFFQYHMGLRALQGAQYSPQDSWRRIRDGKPASIELMKPAGDTFDDMRDIAFRVGEFGRLECTVDGEDYYRQWSVNRDNVAPPELVIALMDYVGVDALIVEHDHWYGSMNRYLSECADRFPGRFLPLAQIREWEADKTEQLERLEHAVSTLHLRGLYFSVEGLAPFGWPLQLDDAALEPLWQLIARLEIPIFWYVFVPKRHEEQIDRLTRWAQRHPEIQSVLMRPFDRSTFRRDPDRLELPRKTLDCIQLASMHVEVNFITMAPDTEYPYPWAQDALKRLLDEVGPTKLIWCTDMPYIERWVSYRQAMNYVRLHASFMSEQDKALFFGGNAARILGI